MMDIEFLGRIPLCDLESILNRDVEARGQNLIPDTLYLCEHPPTFSYQRWERDKKAIRERMLFDVFCAANEVGVAGTQIKRGGGMMYHGPGQIILAPVVRMRPGLDVRRYTWTLEETMIRTLKDVFSIKAFRIRFNEEKKLWCKESGEPIRLFDDKPVGGVQGVWVQEAEDLRKIGFLGAHLNLRYRVLVHGCALNLAPDLNAFSLIDPCNLPGVEVSSVERIRGFRPKINERFAKSIAEIFSEIIENL